MIWFRAALLAALVGLAVVAFSQAAPTVKQPVEPTPRPTRLPLPTLAPEVVVSRISRSTREPPPRAAPSGPPQVQVVDYGFSPAQMVIAVGTTVVFVNDGNDGHDVTGTGPGGDWRSGPLAPSERYSREFALSGTYTYVCTIHPEMRGRVVVQP